jgi:hypothetical protein
VGSEDTTARKGIGDAFVRFGALPGTVVLSGEPIPVRVWRRGDFSSRTVATRAGGPPVGLCHPAPNARRTTNPALAEAAPVRCPTPV